MSKNGSATSVRNFINLKICNNWPMTVQRFAFTWPKYITSLCCCWRKVSKHFLSSILIIGNELLFKEQGRVCTVHAPQNWLASFGRKGSLSSFPYQLRDRETVLEPHPRPCVKLLTALHKNKGKQCILYFPCTALRCSNSERSITFLDTRYFRVTRSLSSYLQYCQFRWYWTWVIIKIWIH